MTTTDYPHNKTPLDTITPIRAVTEWSLVGECSDYAPSL